MGRKKLENDYQELANELGWQWLGPYPQSVTEPTRWICRNGHEISRSYKRVQERGCVYCTSQNWRKRDAAYHKLGELHGVKPPEQLPENTRQPAIWRAGDQKFEISFRNLLQRRLRLYDGEPIDQVQVERLKRGDIFRTRRSQKLPRSDG